MKFLHSQPESNLFQNLFCYVNNTIIPIWIIKYKDVTIKSYSYQTKIIYIYISHVTVAYVYLNDLSQKCPVQILAETPDISTVLCYYTVLPRNCHIWTSNYATNDSSYILSTHYSSITPPISTAQSELLKAMWNHKQ